MRVTILSENLQKALSLVNHAISSRNQLPILSHVLLETREGKIFLTATDLEIGIETAIQGTIDEEGATTVPAKLFLELITTLPAGKVMLETAPEGLLVSGSKTRATIQATAAEEFPKLYEKKGEGVLKSSTKSFQEILKRIIFTASIESTRPALSGVLFKKVAGGFLLVATDGYRLSLEKITAQEEGGENQMIIPAKLLREVMALKEESEITMFVEQTQKQVLFQQEETTIVGRLIEAEFPNYEKILPTDTATTLLTDREAFLQAVKACAIFARETANVVTLTLTKEKMVVSAKTPSLGENTVDVEVKLTGEENAIAFNVRYLLEFLSVIDSQEIQFEMTGPLNSGVFRLSDSSTYLHLIMPIRTQG